ncbi:hypothetical protein [Tenacibaculum aestuarii]|uniref:hypothetical protein n=1 Tax=Tenacibaculum aestuarii TaxID=362781 RepID=UPI0038941BE2
MADFDPIEIEIALNSPEALQDAAKIEGALKGLDASVSNTESRFKAYVAEKLRANGVSVESIKLTEREVTALKTYINSLRGVKEMMDKATDPTQLGVYNHKLGELQKKIDALLTKGAAQGLENTTTSVENQGKRVQQTKRKWDGLGNSINQLTRELPAFTYSFQTGFMAMSNNFPILADEIYRLITRNKELTTSGQKSVPVWKQVASSFLSWNTLMSVGITLLTVYGKDIAIWFNKILKGEKAVKKLTEAEKKLQEQKKKLVKQITKEYAELNVLVARITKANTTQSQRLKLIEQLNEKYPFFLKNLNKEKVTNQELSDKLREVNSLYVTRIALQSQQKEIEAQFNKLAEKQLKLSKDQIYTEDQLLKLVQKINKDRSSERRLNQIDLENKSYEEQVKLVKQALESEVNYFAQASAQGGKNEQAYKERLANRKRELNLLREYEKYNNRTRFGLQDENELLKEKQNLLTRLEKKHKITLEEINQLFQVDGYKGSGASAKELDERKRLLEKLLALDQEYSRKSLTKDEEELQALRDKFGKIRKLVEAFNADPKNKAQLISLTGLDALQGRAEKSLLYRQDTRKLAEQLAQEQDLFAAYEVLKTKVSTEEATKRYGALLKGFQTYGERLQAEYQKLQDKLSSKEPTEITGAETERLLLLEQKIKEFEVEQNSVAEQRFIDAYNSAITHKELLVQIERDFAAQKKEINLISDQQLREAKIKELNYQKQLAVDAANAEAYEKATIFENLSVNLIDITRRELAVRIDSIEDYLQKTKGLLSKEQEAYVRGELERAKAIKAATTLGVQEKALLQEKERVLKRIVQLQAKGIANIGDELAALEEVNGKLKQLSEAKLNQLANGLAEIGGALKSLATALKDYDESLADTIDTLGDLTNVTSDAVGAFASFASGDILGGITGLINVVGGLFSLGAKARESERKAREEIKKWHQEIFESQLAYNSALRQRLSDEIKLNDLYKSRVDNIKEEIEANKKKHESVIEDQQEVFKRLLNAQTIIGKRTKKYGGFLGIGRKTKVVDVKKTIGELLGIGELVTKQIKFGTGFFSFKAKIKVFEPGELELTDEIFEKLEKLNRDKPLTGDAKLAYEQLKKLRDEYGSIEEAQRQLEKQLKDAVTGTTAQALAESIKQGIASGKKSFADFAEDIERFLRDAILAGMSAKVIEPEMQKLQDLLYDFLGDGVLTEDEKQQFQEMYMRIAEEAQEYLNLINSTGIGIGDTINEANSLKGAVKGITAEQADLLAGQFGGLRLTQLETNTILKVNHAAQLEVLSRQAGIQIDIEKNTRRTADNTEKLKSIDTTLKEIKDGDNTSARAHGI